MWKCEETRLFKTLREKEHRSHTAWFQNSLKHSYTNFMPVFSSVQFSHSVVSDSLWPHELQHTRPPCLPPTPGVYPNPCPSSRWCHPVISSSVVPFSFCLQSFPALGSFPMRWLFASGGQSIDVSPSASVLPMYIQDWFPLGLTGLIFLQSKGLSRVFSNTDMITKNNLFQDGTFNLFKTGLQNDQLAVHWGIKVQAPDRIPTANEQEVGLQGSILCCFQP